MNNKFLHHTLLAASLMMTLPIAAHAHRAFLLPSSTMTDSANAVVTIDASTSEELFNIDHAVALDNVTVSGPEGITVAPDNVTTGKQRNSFELTLPKTGIYKVALVSDALSASYKVDGQMKRWRGTADSFAKEVPSDAQDLNVIRMQSRVETFVSAGQGDSKPKNRTNWKIDGRGLEMTPLSKPTELFTGDTTTLRFTLDGKPASGQIITIIRGGNRYRDALGEITLKTDQDGKVNIKWPDAGMYWIGTNTGRPQPGVIGTLTQPIIRSSYSATLEVLQP